MRLRELLPGIDVESVSGNTDVAIMGIAYDSRKVRPGFLFVCIQGLQTDGHLYVNSALQNGAAAVVVQTPPAQELAVPVVRTRDTRRALAHLAARFYDFPARKLRLVGVTGTNGKTTVTYLVKSILERSGRKVGLIGTNQILIGDQALPSERTTPESLELQQLLAQMADSGVQDVVMEVSSHSLVLGRVEGLTFACAAFTNLTQDHLDFHQTMEAYFHAKEQLFLQAESSVVNVDEEAGQKLLGQLAIPAMRYGIRLSADVFASDMAFSAAGVSFTLHHDGREQVVSLPIPGSFSVYNALCAASVCLCLGVDEAEVAAGLSQASGVKGRAEVAYRGDDFTVIIDYAHTPDGLENIIRTLKDFATGRVVTVFGCGGNRDRTKRPKMGNIAVRLSDFCVITSDNPRSEPPMRIIEEIVAGIEPGQNSYCVMENRRDAIRFAVENAQSGDVILLAGKGHETYQEIGGEKRHFDEREVLREILSGR